ncbi:MAG: dihydroneopterin aldolase [Clostridia bacterium]|nr:dihydroneopterin aldolase [Clostridia bacterium]
MDRITLKNMKFYSYHGVLPEEQTNGQYFYIDVEMICDLREAGREDDLEKTVDYSVVYNIIKNITQKNKFRLIECLADRISREIATEFKMISEIVVRVRKPEAPIDGELDWAEVELRRGRNDL